MADPLYLLQSPSRDGAEIADFRGRQREVQNSVTAFRLIDILAIIVNGMLACANSTLGLFIATLKTYSGRSRRTKIHADAVWVPRDLLATKDEIPVVSLAELDHLSCPHLILRVFHTIASDTDSVN